MNSENEANDLDLAYTLATIPKYHPVMIRIFDSSNITSFLCNHLLVKRRDHNHNLAVTCRISRKLNRNFAA